MDWFVIRVRNNEATAIVAGPCTGPEAYSAFASASMDEDCGLLVVVPSSITSDFTARMQKAGALGYI